MVLSKGVPGQVYNVGSDTEISNLTLCKILLDEFALDSDDESLQRKIDFVRDRPFNDHRYAVDGSKLKALGWTQNTPFAEGLRATVNWYKRFGESWWGDISGVLTPFPTAFVDEKTGESGLRAGTPVVSTNGVDSQASFGGP